MRQMDNPLDILESIADALMSSETSRARRNAGAGRLIAPPSPGTPLLVSLALAVEHTGIYLGNNRVAELRCDGTVAAATLTEFINGDSEDPLSLRNGTRIFAACDARTRKPIGAHRVWQTAQEAVRRGASRPYDILQDNCHLFVAACAAGVFPSPRRNTPPKGGMRSWTENSFPWEPTRSTGTGSPFPQPPPPNSGASVLNTSVYFRWAGTPTR